MDSAVFINFHPSVLGALYLWLTMQTYNDQLSKPNYGGLYGLMYVGGVGG